MQWKHNSSNNTNNTNNKNDSTSNSNRHFVLAAAATYLRVFLFTYEQAHSLGLLLLMTLPLIFHFLPRFCRPAYQRRSKELPLPVT